MTAEIDDVIVVGGGPTGFINALGLAQAGLRVTVLEAEAQISDSPRAAVYFWSVLDGLERLGILEEAERIGFRKQDYTWLVGATGERIEYTLEVLEGHTAHPYNLHLGQHYLADIALRRLAELPNARVLFNTRLKALVQDTAGVTLCVEATSGPKDLRAKWVIGADGASSTVRHQLGLSFDGMTWPERFVATNVFFDFERYGFARSTFLIDDHHGAVIAQIDRSGLWRCTYMEDGALPEATFLERLPDAYQAILPGADDYTVERASPYRMHQRSAPRYRVGRVLLAGDAAHATNPTGGLGLTAALFDSYALYPSLVAIILDGASTEILDRYSQERRDVFVNRASPQASANKQLIFHANGGGKQLEEALAAVRRSATDRDFLRERLMFTKSLETPTPLACISGKGPRVTLARVVTTEVLGHRLQYRPFDAWTPDGLRICGQDWWWRAGSTGAIPARDVLLIHGISQSHLCWLKQLASPLPERYRLVTYDLRGHGGSDKPSSREYYQDGARWAGEVQAVIEAAGLKRPVILAWSYGGRAALDYLQVAGGEAIAGLVMVAATSCADRALFGPGAPLLASMAVATDLARNIDATRGFLTQCVATPLPAAEQDLMLAYNLMVPPAVRAAMGGRPAPYETLLRCLNVAVLAIHGEQDTMVLPAMAHYTVRNCARAAALIYEGIGHAPFWEAPERFNADLAAWLDRAAGPIP